MRKLILLILFLILSLSGFTQFVEKGSFKIFRGSVAGADINFRLNSDYTYEISAVAFWCSLCDMEKMSQEIFQKGIWAIINDSIRLNPNDTNTYWYFKKINEITLKPLFSVNREYYNIKNDSFRNKMIFNSTHSDLFNFNLIYETDTNGILKEAKYELPNSKNKYIITFDRSGNIQKIERHRKGKKYPTLLK